jgi:hypothetical protein
MGRTGQGCSHVACYAAVQGWGGAVLYLVSSGPAHVWAVLVRAIPSAGVACISIRRSWRVRCDAPQAAVSSAWLAGASIARQTQGPTQPTCHPRPAACCRRPRA